ncbi:MAG: hypothetical protein HKM05_03680 [Spirochaetales bacterium]|nr:hypothetical protein [Spirochaetales bacterium]
MSSSWLFLDFDGVICDSLPECYQTSSLLLPGVPGENTDESYARRFREGRVYIRSGEDYVALHKMLREGHDPQSQQEFDAVLKAMGHDTMSRYKQELYSLRERLLRDDPETWLSWNPLYEGMTESLNLVRGDPLVWILSTKKAEFIEAILHHHGVSWPLERIRYTDGRSKLSWINTIAGHSPSLLIDDQIDHLDFTHPTCSCRLALWGYASTEARQRGVPSLTLTEAHELLRARA